MLLSVFSYFNKFSECCCIVNCQVSQHFTVHFNAAARMNGLSYSQLMHGLKLAEIEVNRKMLADLAVNDAAAFTALADAAKAKLGK